MLETKRIDNIYSYLNKSKESEIVIRTTLVSGGWHDIEFDAHASGYKVCRFQNEEMLAKRQFAECYKFFK